MDRALRPGAATSTSHIEAPPDAAPGRTTLDPETLAGGQPLPGPTLARMNRSFGAELSSVRIHEGTGAARFSAMAYTRGEHIFFAPGRFAPETPAGRELLGHELSHVLQQRRGGISATHDSGANADASHEAEADAHGRAAAHDEPTGAAPAHGTAPDDGPAQAKQLTQGQITEIKKNGHGAGYYFIDRDGTPHIKAHLDDASGLRLYQALQAKTAKWGDKGKIATVPEGIVLNYVEFHVTLPGKHFFYSDVGFPLEKNSLNHYSPHGDDPGWALANQMAAQFTGADVHELNKEINKYGGKLPTGEPEPEPPPQPQPRAPQNRNSMMQAMIARKQREAALKTPAVKKPAPEVVEDKQPSGELKRERDDRGDSFQAVLDDHSLERDAKKPNQNEFDRDRDGGGGLFV